MPKRIQRKRTKGWRMPENCRCVTRPGIFGNPFRVAGAREAGYRGTDEQLGEWCVDLFRRWLNGEQGLLYGEVYDCKRRAILKRLPELRGKDLACFCSLDAPCHADILLELANKEPTHA